MGRSLRRHGHRTRGILVCRERPYARGDRFASGQSAFEHPAKGPVARRRTERWMWCTWRWWWGCSDCRGRSWCSASACREGSMYVIGGLVALGLFAYLLVALLKPEVFS